jgi:hypothetical protein
LPERELFLVSHGSWQNRWKLSLTPGRLPRWTVRTTSGTADLDAPSALAVGAYVHLAATYDGAALRLYVNGQPAGERAHTGAMPATDLPLLLGQMLPGQPEYNFPGALDEVRVYNRALSAAEVVALYDGTIAAEPAPGAQALALGQPYPNPSRGRLTIPLQLPRDGAVTVRVVDVLGRTVAVLHDGPLAAGAHALGWAGAGGDGRPAAAGVYLVRVDAGDRSAARAFLHVR